MSHFSSLLLRERHHASELEIIDGWVSEMAEVQLRDALLDLRTACAELPHRPMAVVRKFLRLRPRLKQSSYLSQHRLRRALENRIILEITTPNGCSLESLRLDWETLDLTLNHARREVFEQGLAEWDEIRIRLITRF